MSERKFWLVFWLIIGVFASATISGVTMINCKHIQKMASIGFQKTMVIGNDYAVWQKVGK